LLPRGIPRRKEDWPNGLLEHLRLFRQGHVVHRVPVFYWGDPAYPVFALTREYDSEGVCEMELKYGLITTQTCDIAEEDSDRPSRPWVHVAPVYDATEEDESGSRTLDGGERKLAAQGRIQHLLHLPALDDGLWVADLRLALPFDKGWLASRTPIQAFHNDKERYEVGRRLAYMHRRPAFDPTFVRVVQQPLVAALRALSKDDRELFERLHHDIHEIGVRTDRNSEMGFAEVWALGGGDVRIDCVEWLREQWDDWHGRADAAGFRLLPLRIESLTDMSAADYRTLTALPLANISPSNEWYGPDPYESPVPPD
jgi:hypothetical protein